MVTAEEPSAFHWTRGLERYSHLAMEQHSSLWPGRHVPHSCGEWERIVCDGAQHQSSVQFVEMRGGRAAGHLSDAGWLADRRCLRINSS